MKQEERREKREEQRDSPEIAHDEDRLDDQGSLATL
jgi:hypothetical protein